jgi:hypothetical protein
MWRGPPSASAYHAQPGCPHGLHVKRQRLVGRRGALHQAKNSDQATHVQAWGCGGGGGSCYPPFVGGRLRAHTSRPEVFVEMQTARAGHASGPTGPRWLGFVTC